MLVVFFKSLITFFVVLLIIRLMGKRQIGEMQPFELVITLIIAEVACIPMNDPYIPFYNGIIPIVTLAVMHVLLSFLGRKSLIVRRLMSGNSIIVIDKNGINFGNLKKMNINMNDLIEAVRCSGYVDFTEIEYAIFETNGKLSVIEKQSDPTKSKPAYLPLTLLIDGKWDNDNLLLSGATAPIVTEAVKKKGIKNIKSILYIDVRQDGTIYVAPKYEKDFVAKINIKGGENW